ncbi:MAG TPA: response regulator transcription factor [Chitinophagaceae bacterium]|nr:response regulator transcription factor [Chitinophagaceae bacterium]
MPNLLLVDDHSVIRKGMKIIIENFLPHVTIDEADDGDSAFEKIKGNNYDLVILDVNMPNTDSLGLVTNILALKPGMKILMFSMNDEEVYAKRYLKMGVMGYVKKDEPEAEIRKAITSVLNNKKYISPRLSQIMIEDLHGNNNAENPFDNLSPREFEIVQHLIRGESLAEICNKLTLHSSTVGTHKARIFEKLKCKNIIDLNSLAKVHNIISLS